MVLHFKLLKGFCYRIFFDMLFYFIKGYEKSLLRENNFSIKSYSTLNIPICKPIVISFKSASDLYGNTMSIYGRGKREKMS